MDSAAHVDATVGTETTAVEASGGPDPALTSRIRTELAVETAGLVKTYGGTPVVDELALAVPAGTVYGLLGPHGSGKTTTLRILATLLSPDGGTARVFGRDVVHEPDAVRARVSLAGQRASVDEDLTGRHNLALLARLLGYGWRAARRRANELLDAFGLGDLGRRPVRTYPPGPRRRLDIAASVVVLPDLLLLDEPTAGLDPRGRGQVWDVVRALADAGTTVLLASSDLHEVDRLADRIAVLHRGRVIEEGTGADLRASVGTAALRVRVGEPGQRLAAERTLSRALGAPVRLEADPLALSARVADQERVAHALAQLSRTGVTLTEFAVTQPGLDEVFLALTGRPAEADPAEVGV